MKGTRTFHCCTPIPASQQTCLAQVPFCFRAGVSPRLGLGTKFDVCHGVAYIRCRRYVSFLAFSSLAKQQIHCNHTSYWSCCVYPITVVSTLRAAMDHYGDLAQMAQHFSVSMLSEHSGLLLFLPSLSTAVVFLHAIKDDVHTLSVGDRRKVSSCYC